MKIVLLCACACVLSSVHSLVLIVTEAVQIENVFLFKDGLELPHFMLTYDVPSFADSTLHIDSGRAYFDVIVIVKKELLNETLHQPVLLSVFDSHSRLWEGSFECRHFSTRVKEFEISSFITAPPLIRPRVVDIFPYNGDFIALFRLQYLYNYVDEFIIIEARCTFSGVQKPALLFTTDENREKFAPYMEKITYVVVEEFPPYPDSGNSGWLSFSQSFSPEFSKQLSGMLVTPNFWRANYQRLFSKFFLRPISDRGEQQLVLVTDCDELPNRTHFPQLHDLIKHNPHHHEPIPLFMMFFYYNFNTVNPFSWMQAYVITTQGYLALTDMLSPRIPPPTALPSLHVKQGGWHLSYFMSLDEIRRKMNSIAEQSIHSTESTTGMSKGPLRTESPPATLQSDEHLRHCIDHSQDLYTRQDPVSLAWTSRSSLRVTSFPEGWEEVQRQLVEAQSRPG